MSRSRVKSKGLAIKYLMLFFLMIVFLAVGIGIVRYFYEHPGKYPTHDLLSNVSYECIQLNDTVISFQEFEDVLYGFLTGQCDGFYARIDQKITVTDIERTVNRIDSSVQVFQIDICSLPEVNSHSVYVNFSEIEDEDIYLRKRKIENSDVLICGG